MANIVLPKELVLNDDMEKNPGAEPRPIEQETDVAAGEVHHKEQQDLHRGLKARHLSMIGENIAPASPSENKSLIAVALGGAIGTGLIIGSGQGLAACGPLSLLIGYAITGVLCFIVMTALGEMATWLPLGTSFPGYATRYVDPALGFSLGWW